MDKISGVDWGSVARMLTGGAMLGGGVGSAVAFVNHLKELQAGARAPSEDDPDHDVLYLDLPRNRLMNGAQPIPNRRIMKRAAANNSNTASTFALSSLAGLVGSALAYNTVRDVYNRRRKREIESDLGQAQHVYLGNLPGTKTASQYSIPTKMVGTGYLAFLLTALGSAVVANKMLQKRFPPLKSPTAGQPRKIVIRSVDPKTRQPLNEGTSMDGGTSPDAMEGLVRTQMADTKMAAHNELVDVIHAVAAGRADEIKNLIKIAGVDGMLAAVKGASHDKTDPIKRNLAVTWICHDPLVKEALAPLVAAEFFKCASWTFDLLPHLSSMGLDEEHLIGMVESSTRAVRENILRPFIEKAATCSMTKSAEEGEGLSPIKTLFFAGALKSIMDSNPKEHDDSPTGHSLNVMTSDESPIKEKDRKHQGVNLEVSDDNALDFAKSYMPAVDKTLARQV